MITREEILKSINFRYACKKFNPEKIVSNEDFQLILEAARLSPSSFGFEPWAFLVVENSDLKEKLKNVAWGATNSLNGASHFVIILARKKVDTIHHSEYLLNFMTEVKKLSKEASDARMDRFTIFQEKDFDLLKDDRNVFDWACKQTYIALANMMTTAALLEIDTCAVEGFNREATEKLLENEGFINTEHFGVSVMLGIGYRDEQQPEKTRWQADKVIKKI